MLVLTSAAIRRRVRAAACGAGIVSEARCLRLPAWTLAASAEERVRASFARQGLMRHLGAGSPRSARARARSPAGPAAELTQQHGYVHAGVVAAIADSAAGYAALSLAPPGSEVLTVEFKLNLLAPAEGELLIARGRCVRAGRTLTVCEARSRRSRDGEETQCAVALVTMIAARERLRGSARRRPDSEA